jgi:hypothetical protein
MVHLTEKLWHRKSAITAMNGKTRKSSTGGSSHLAFVTKPAEIVSMVSRKLTMGATPGSGMYRVRECETN